MPADRLFGARLNAAGFSLTNQSARLRKGAGLGGSSGNHELLLHLHHELDAVHHHLHLLHLREAEAIRVGNVEHGPDGGGVHPAWTHGHSLRYHHLNPDYIHERLRALGRSFGLQVLLLQVDVRDPHQALKDLAKVCLLTDCTLLLAWSAEEAGRYLETFKSYEQKPPDLLKERVEQDFLSRVTDCLTSVKSVNKTDALSLLGTFGSLAAVAGASREDLSLCPGVGPQKAKRLFDVLHEPFLKTPR
ncbi:DNA excision repair protein ERCC-1-like [Catharus ustulatus]|uniref:DNA excision repair protein ERCC-1-like n=1 Tax=Catharus ustulatus TaxID=91951 RepID=UPI001409CCFC|nr:DNA excision repair protein ERCC-1-like [Catharus ustulatus]